MQVYPARNRLAIYGESSTSANPLQQLSAIVRINFGMGQVSSLSISPHPPPPHLPTPLAGYSLEQPEKPGCP